MKRTELNDLIFLSALEGCYTCMSNDATGNDDQNCFIHLNESAEEKCTNDKKC